MLKIGITGKMGSGKSIVCDFFEKLNIPVYRSDIEAKKFFSMEAPKQQMIAAFGKEICLKEETIDTQKLASIVFNDEKKLKILNSIIHPLVKNDFMNWCLSQKKYPYLIFESAIIYESGFAPLFQKIIYVSTDEQIAIKRIMERSKMSHTQIIERLKHQTTPSQKPDFTILNDEKHLIIPQILKIHEELLNDTH